MGYYDDMKRVDNVETSEDKIVDNDIGFKMEMQLKMRDVEDALVGLQDIITAQTEQIDILQSEIELLQEKDYVQQEHIEYTSSIVQTFVDHYHTTNTSIDTLMRRLKDKTIKH